MELQTFEKGETIFNVGDCGDKQLGEKVLVLFRHHLSGQGTTSSWWAASACRCQSLPAPPASTHKGERASWA